MESLWNGQEVEKLGEDPLALRVYSSRLLGLESSLVLHGGGNTSVKASTENIFGEKEDLLYVKGSGWDLATIEKAGFAPVKMDVLLKMARLQQLTDTDMVCVQRSAMTDPGAPNPSVEAILHAIIPFRYVDHTHADAVVTITNTPEGQQRVRDIYGDRVLIIPYVMPGFILAKTVYDLTQGLDWTKYDGMILMNHGVFTFNDDAKLSYEKMIQIVDEAESYLKQKGVRPGGFATDISNGQAKGKIRQFFSDIKNFFKPPIKGGGVSGKTVGEASTHLRELASIRYHVSRQRGAPVLARFKADETSLAFAGQTDIVSVATRGPLTPDHVIRTKRTPAILTGDAEQDVEKFSKDYEEYFKRNAQGGLVCLDRAPRWAVWPGQGTVAFGRTVKDVNIISDIIDHTMWAIGAAEKLDRWQALPEKDIFEVEYWELEQAKLKKAGASSMFQGKIALVTGAASGIGRSCVEMLCAQGAVVAALDINPEVEQTFNRPDILGVVCDVTKGSDMHEAVEAVVARFGGLDIVVSNAGIFPPGEAIADLKPETWNRSMDINLSSHQWLLQECIPYLSVAIDPSIVIVASKNVPAPGPGASAYSVAKAGLTQLARVAALELGEKGIRVNVVHPNQVFDTAIWTPEVLINRAKHYGMDVDQYKRNNLLKTEITSVDVAQLVCAMAGPVFAKTTGAQIPIDGGNDRVV